MTGDTPEAAREVAEMVAAALYEQQTSLPWDGRTERKFWLGMARAAIRALAGSTKEGE